MTWRVPRDDVESLAAELSDGLAGEGWTVRTENVVEDRWSATWSLTGRDGSPWSGETRLQPMQDGRVELNVAVEKE